PRRHAGHRLVLHAAGHRAHRRARPAGVRDRGGRDAGDPTHGRDAAVHLLRGLVDRGQLRAAGAAAARVRPRPAGGSGGVAQVSVPISRVFGVIVVLFAVLVAWPSRWTVFESKSLRDNPANRRTLLEEAQIPRGLIEGRDGSILAHSVPAGGGTWR